MKIFVLFLLIINSTLSFGQKWDINTTIIDSVKYFVYPKLHEKQYSCPSSDIIWAAKSKERDLPNGKWVMFFKEDTTKMVLLFEIKNRLLNGHLIEFYFNGNMSYDGYYELGEEKSFIRYYVNGNLKSFGQYRNYKFQHIIYKINT